MNLDATFGPAAHGVRWAAGQCKDAAFDGGELRIGGRAVRLEHPGAAARDNFAVRFAPGAVTVSAGTATGAIGAFLELARRQAAGGERDFAQALRFRTRLYKHEIAFDGGARKNGHPAITEYSPRFTEAFFQELAKRHFNAIVLYAGYHPFEYFLDYDGRPHYTERPAEVRARNFDALRRLYATARQYGLKTFLHHYVSHFTQSLSDHLGLGLKEGGTRLANFDHPEVDEYCRYVYRRTFQTLPELDGLFLNFESCGNSINLLKKTLFTVTSEMERKPALVFRLWGVSDVEGMAGLIRAYPGPKALKHKGHDTNDVYYYPVGDDRVKVWKKALPEVEFFLSNGPCHNCGTNISHRLWLDPGYVHALLKNFQDKGADSVTFQSVFELLLPRLPDSQIFPERSHAAARMNQGHLQAVADYVRGERPAEAEWVRRTAGYFGISERAAAAAWRATVESSNIILKQYRQFCYGSAQEGYLYPGRFSHYQEPFFYYPMSFLNRIGEIPHNVAWLSWAVRKKKLRVVPDDTQAPIDFANPAVRRKPANHPLALANQIEGHVRAARKALAAYKRETGAQADGAFVREAELNCLNGERIFREIRVAVELCSCYFAKNKAAFWKHLKQARKLLLDAARVLGADLRQTDHYCSTTSSGPFSPAQDAAELEALLRFEKQDFPFAALQAYLHSHERYNEIRRLCRPYASVREEMQRRNRGLLRQALRAAETAVQRLNAPEHALLRDNALAWAEYLRAEIDWLTPPAMACAADETLEPNAGFRALVHDQCYRWGERCWEDFSSFFRRRDFFREDDCDCRATYTRTGLKVTLREHGIDWSEREATWDKNRGTVNQTGFMQLVLEPGVTCKRMIHYTIYFRGEGGTVECTGERADGLPVSTKPTVMRGCKTNFSNTNSNWRFEIEIPWEQLGGRMPRPGEVWRMNLFTNPAVKRNRRVIWCQAYEFRNEFYRMGRLVFV